MSEALLLDGHFQKLIKAFHDRNADLKPTRRLLLLWDFQHTAVVEFLQDKRHEEFPNADLALNALKNRRVSRRIDDYRNTLRRALISERRKPLMDTEAETDSDYEIHGDLKRHLRRLPEPWGELLVQRYVQGRILMSLSEEYHLDKSHIQRQCDKHLATLRTWLIQEHRPPRFWPPSTPKDLVSLEYIPVYPRKSQSSWEYEMLDARDKVLFLPETPEAYTLQHDPAFKAYIRQEQFYAEPTIETAEDNDGLFEQTVGEAADIPTDTYDLIAEPSRQRDRRLPEHFDGVSRYCGEHFKKVYELYQKYEHTVRTISIPKPLSKNDKPPAKKPSTVLDDMMRHYDQKAYMANLKAQDRYGLWKPLPAVAPRKQSV